VRIHTQGRMLVLEIAPHVRGLLRSRLRGTVVPAAASVPESSHVFERTWSRRSVWRARASEPAIAAEL
ncbi:hypothetical protein AB0D38_46335, partial [Streptomyces sp. NPDC048279]|uniref:hypothetical protein n=1 Tax=Streptomyces sp. NPDC048279 TaxID=3154714 RepID=UPI0034138A89